MDSATTNQLLVYLFIFFIIYFFFIFKLFIFLDSYQRNDQHQGTEQSNGSITTRDRTPSEWKCKFLFFYFIFNVYFKLRTSATINTDRPSTDRGTEQTDGSITPSDQAPSEWKCKFLFIYFIFLIFFLDSNEQTNRPR